MEEPLTYAEIVWIIVLIMRLDDLYPTARASLVISPGDLPSISDERLVADALIRLSLSQSDDKNRLLKNQLLAEIGHATINYCLTLAVCKALDDDWKGDECTVR